MSSNETTDEMLLDRFKAGEAKAFEELMRRHQTSLFNFIYRSVRHRQTAEEIFQDTWIRVLQGINEFQRASKFTTWAFTVARNLCIDHARKAVLRRHPSLDQKVGSGEDGPNLGDLVKDSSPRADRNAISAEMQVKMVEAINALPAEQREVFLLREQADLPFKEIALIVSAPENTVKSRMRYALERLQEALAEYEDYARALG